MADPGTSNIRKELFLEEIVNRKKMGDKNFHSETSLQKFEEEDQQDYGARSDWDPGAVNVSVNGGSTSDELPARRRTVSQPGPVSGSLLTATAARAARRRLPRSVNYAADVDRNESNDGLSPKLQVLNRGDDSSLATPVGDQNSPLPYNGAYRSNGDVKSLNCYRIYTPASEMRFGGATPRKRSVGTMDAQSIRSVETPAPAPTSTEDNRRLTVEYLNIILSSIYGIILVTFGFIIYLSEPFIEYQNTSTIYSLILISIGFVYHIYLIIDIGRYKSTALKNKKTKNQHEEKVAEYFRKQEEEFGISMPGTPGSENLPQLIPPPTLVPLKHAYCFNQGRHSGSFYLKLGATESREELIEQYRIRLIREGKKTVSKRLPIIHPTKMSKILDRAIQVDVVVGVFYIQLDCSFAMGHLVHSVLLIVSEISHILDEDIDNDSCVDYLRIVLDVFTPIYCFLQLYFVFKYSNVIILHSKGLACYAFMHIIGSSLCFWVSTIVRETVVALTIYAYSQYGPGGPYENGTDSYIVETSRQSRIFDVSGLYNDKCIGSTGVMNVIESFSPYLYPFSVEFNILIVAIYYIIWSNIGNCDNEDLNNSDSTSSFEDNNTVCQIPTANEGNDFTSNIVINVDCHASNRGMFMGLVLTVIVVGMLIIGFIFSNSKELLAVGNLLNDCTKLGVHLAMLFAAIFAYNQTRKLDINEYPISLLDDILLFICIPAFVLETVLSMVATLNIINVVKTVDLLVMMIQVVLQTALLVDGLRRCSNSSKLRRKKPARELLMFLIIANVSMWLLNTFSYKSPESLDERYEFYGKVTWTVLGHISLPLIMFYRFHSSVCFVDMWDSAYKPGAEH